MTQPTDYPGDELFWRRANGARPWRITLRKVWHSLTHKLSDEDHDDLVSY